MNEIIYIEDTSANYGHRTYVNVSKADATLAFAIDFNSSGEICTKKSALLAKKIYIPININSDIYLNIGEVATKLKYCHKINIAGNGIATLSKYGISQDECDQIVYNFLYKLITEYNCNFTEIRSGGQTGFDEAGIKAGFMLNIKTVCYFPKGWRYRTVKKDISNEESFKKRFI